MGCGGAGAGSREREQEQGAGSREQEQGAGSREQGAVEQGAGSREQGAGSRSRSEEREQERGAREQTEVGAGPRQVPSSTSEGANSERDVWKSGRKCGRLLARCVQRDLSPPHRRQGPASGAGGVPPGARGARPAVVVTLLDQCLAVYPPAEWAPARGPARRAARFQQAGQGPHAPPAEPRRRLRDRRAGTHPPAARAARVGGARARRGGGRCPEPFRDLVARLLGRLRARVGAPSRRRLPRHPVASPPGDPHRVASPPAAPPPEPTHPQAKPNR